MLDIHLEMKAELVLNERTDTRLGWSDFLRESKESMDAANGTIDVGYPSFHAEHRSTDLMSCSIDLKSFSEDFEEPLTRFNELSRRCKEQFNRFYCFARRFFQHFNRFKELF